MPRLVLAVITLAILVPLPTVWAGTAITAELVVDDLDGAIDLNAPDGDPERIFILQRAGRIWIAQNGVLQPTPFLDISDDVLTGGERGLLGFDFHPLYNQNGFVFVRYNNNAGDTVVERYTVSAGNPNAANPASGFRVLTIPTSNQNHNGGWIEFGLDGYLYISVGDDVDSDLAQDIDDLHGKILRIDIDGDDFPADSARNYRIPPGNPFAGPGVPGADEIWATGLRNPFRASFDRLTGDMWIGDVGALDWEEVSVQPATSLGGENYGWDCMEASLCHDSGACSCADAGLTPPIFEYDHDTGCAIIGGRVYRGCDIPDLQGAYFCADYCSDTIWSFRYEGGSVVDLQQRQEELDPPGSDSIASIVGFGEDGRGELYICDLGGQVFKIVPVDPPLDTDGDGIPDACETDVAGDVTGDGLVDVSDLLAIMMSYGPCLPPPVTCPADLDASGIVDVSDLLEVINFWG
jgi:glucose/arabinose dehydrogenase